MGGVAGGGVTNMISISFSGIRMLWLPPPIINFSSFMPHFSPPLLKYEEIWIAYAEMPSVGLFCECTPSPDYTQVQTNAYRHMGSILTSYWYFVEQTEMSEWNQLWDWAFQQAYVTRDQWTYTLTRIRFAEKHHTFQCLYVHNWFYYLWKRIYIYFFPFLIVIVSAFLFISCLIT